MTESYDPMRSIYQTAIYAILEKHCDTAHAADAIKQLFALWCDEISKHASKPACAEVTVGTRRRRVVTVKYSRQHPKPSALYPNHGLRWSDTHDEYLRSHMNTLSITELCKQLGRPPQSIKQRIRERMMKERGADANA